GCCECHDHKFDPFTMKDFYAMEAFFADIKQWGVYQDYGYTPNPDLKGWSNDHPFPPEIEVVSPYLVRRQEQFRQRLMDLVAASAQKLTADRRQKAAFEDWVRAGRDFLKQAPDGWLTPPVTLPAGTKDVVPQKDGSLLLGGRVTKRGGERKLS